MNKRTREIMTRITDLRERIGKLELTIDKYEYRQANEENAGTRQDLQNKIWCAREALIDLNKKLTGWQMHWEHDIAMIHYHG